VKDLSYDIRIRLYGVGCMQTKEIVDERLIEALVQLLNKMLPDPPRYDNSLSVIEALSRSRPQTQETAELIYRFALKKFPKEFLSFPDGVFVALQSYRPASHPYFYQFIRENNLAEGILPLWKSVIVHDDLSIATKMISADWLKGQIRYGTQNSSEHVNYRLTPLGFALCRGNRTMVLRLIEKGADLHAFGLISTYEGENRGRAQRRYKVKPLFFAAYQNDLELLQLMVDKGAKLQTSGYAGCSVIDAVEKNNIKEFLEEQGDVPFPGCDKQVLKLLTCSDGVKQDEGQQ